MKLFFAAFCLCLAIISFFATYRIAHGEEAPDQKEQYRVWNGQSPLVINETIPRRVVINKSSGPAPTYIIVDHLPPGAVAVDLFQKVRSEEE
jgi:hypothetical protein